MRRDPSRLVERSTTPPSYPQFTGFEPCAQIGPAIYVRPEGWKYGTDELVLLREGCWGCPLQPECLEWALHRERWGFWGGKTAKERKRMRQERGIRVSEPHYEILGLRESDDDAAA